MKNINRQIYIKPFESDNPSFKQSFYKIVNAFETFKRFLRDDEEYVDYTYLWDIITTPNPKLFSSGLNLIILRIPDDDITDNVEVVCPTNAYSSQKFNNNKGTLVLIQQDTVFEPIIVYKNLETKISIRNVFRLKGKGLQTLHILFELFFSLLEKYLIQSVYHLKVLKNINFYHQ